MKLDCIGLVATFLTPLVKPSKKLPLPADKPLDTPWLTPPIAPPIKPAVTASFRLPPCISVPIPAPKAPAYIMLNPSPAGPKTKGKTKGAAFLTTLVTFLRALLTPLTSLDPAFFTPLNIFFRKNSGIPVSGLIEFTPEPTTYRSGSSTPSSRR